MDGGRYDLDGLDIAWCPGCGNFSILRALKLALSRLDVEPGNLVLVSGIGQAAKAPHYLRTNVFNGLHGRALPPATAIKAVNPRLTVIAESGDGDMLQPCVSFNKLNTLAWFRENTRELPSGYDPSDRQAALRTAFEDIMALGVIYVREGRPTFEDQVGLFSRNQTPLPFRSGDRGAALRAVLRTKH